MKLAEALAERKALDARLSSIEGRLRANARIQEGDAVSEDPERLFALLDSTAEELRTLMVRIARTNRETVVDGRPLADWIAERDVSVRRFNILSGVADIRRPFWSGILCGSRQKTEPAFHPCK